MVDTEYTSLLIPIILVIAIALYCLCIGWILKTERRKIFAKQEALQEESEMGIIAQLDEQCPAILYVPGCAHFTNKVAEKSGSKESEELVIGEIPDTTDIEAPEEKASAPKESGFHLQQFVCSICLGEFEDQDSLRQLQCSHLFHKACVDKWVLAEKDTPSQGRCPMCRTFIFKDYKASYCNKLKRITGDWDHNGQPVATITEDCIFWWHPMFSVQSLTETKFVLNGDVIKMRLNGRSYKGTIGDGHINWSDGDRWARAVPPGDDETYTHLHQAVDPQGLQRQDSFRLRT